MCPNCKAGAHLQFADVSKPTYRVMACKSCSHIYIEDRKDNKYNPKPGTEHK